MQKEDIEHLALLARIEIPEAEATALAQDITGILGYVSEIDEITGGADIPKEVGALYNVVREDTNPHEPGLYTDAILKSAPEREGNYIVVKKILKDT